MENTSAPRSNINLNFDTVDSNPVPQKRKDKKLIIILIILIFVTSGLILFFLTQRTKSTKNNPINVLNNSNTPTTKNNEIESSSANYRNEVLGVEFNYPKTWGEVVTSPVSTITHLETVNKDFLNLEDNHFRYMVRIGFSKNSWAYLNFINNKYLGENYSNGFAYKYGPMDNFSKLINTQDICQYHFSFNNVVDSRNVIYTEKYNECKDGVKTTLFLDDPGAVDSLNNRYYNYSIQQYFYKKLNNGYFDNLLINNLLASYQGSESSLNFDQIISKNKLPISSDSSILDFKKFVSSIKVFDPPTPTPITFSQNSNLDPNIITIHQYYFYLATQKLTDAYEMYSDKNVSFEKFSQWYKQVFNTKIYNLRLISPNVYKFYVDLSEKNASVSKYLVTMEVNNSKVNTISSEQILSDEVKFGDYSAYIRLKSGKNEVVLIKNGVEKVIDSGDNDFQNKIGTSMSFHNPKFSPQGGYLIYDAGGWEWMSPTLYNLAQQQKVKIDLSYAGIFFSQDEKYLLACTSAGLGSGVSAIIYSAPDFSVKKDFKDTINKVSYPDSADCSYSPEKSEINIIISGIEKQQKTIKYNLVTEKEITQ